MKKVIIASIAALALVLGSVATASAAGYTFSNYLTVGSTGADVSALQTWLIANHFSIPSITSGAAQTGYFGQQTKAAVIQYQASIGLPATGFVGPLTVAKLNAGGGVAMSTTPTTVTCPIGYTCTAQPGTVGTTPSSPANTNPGSISTPGIAGTLSLSLWSTPSNGTSVYKGQSYDIASYKVQAGASDMLISNFALDFSDRLWLYAGTITVRDDSGAVVGQVSNLNLNNFTELTTGSDYRITIPISNYVVKATQTRYLTVNVSFLPTSDRTNTTLYITRAQVRSVDGTGVTDTEVLGDTTTGNANARSFMYNGSNSGQLVVTTDAASPLQSLVQISTAAQTQDVPLAIYDIKSQNSPSTLQSLTLGVFTNGTASVASTFANIKIKINGTVYSANTIGGGAHDTAASSTVTFTNLQNIVLPADTYVPITVTGTVTQDTNNVLDGVTASTSLVVGGAAGNSTNNPVVVDQSYNNLAVNQGTFTSSNLTFSASSATLSNYIATLGSAITNNNTTTGYGMQFGFTITAGNNTLYISADPNIALATSSTGLSTGSSSLPIGGVIANPGNIAGDSNVSLTSGYYVVTAGSSRSFTFNGSIDNTNGTRGLKSFSISAVRYGTSPSNLSSNSINYNLNTLKVNPTF